MRKSRAALIIAVVALLSVVALALAANRRPPGGPSLILGVRTIESNADGEPSGDSEAFPFRAVASGTARWLALYVDTGNQARTVHVAVYSSSGGNPRTLLASGATRHPAAEEWNHIRISAVALHRGDTYWVAVLGTQGAVTYRDRLHGSCSSQESAQTSLTGFPHRWSSGRRWSTCSMSVAVGATASVRLQKPSRSGTHKPTGTTKPPTSTSETNCVASPIRCGFPDPSDTGVPAGTALTPSGSISVNTPNATISGLAVSGTIDIYASGVTITDTSVTTQDTADPGIVIHGPATGITIENTTIAGAPGTATGIAIHNTTGTDMTVEGVYIHDAADGVDGLQNTSNSYVITDGYVPGAHVEPVYLPGAGPSNPESTVEHNTLLNPQDQVAAVFADCHAYGPCWNMAVNDNLMQGGDYTVECCDGSGAVSPSGNTSFTNNRFARTYYPTSGQYGWESGIDPSRTTWSGNVWDSTNRPVPAN